jgi:ribulose-phosphate 3-epimerase
LSVQIAPSILSANFARLGEEIAAVLRGGADLIHVDVMDGHFVPNLTMGPRVVESIRDVVKVPMDVHLMIEEPDRYIDAFREAGASMISVHVEVLPHLHRTVHAIKALGAKAGVVLNPSTSLSTLEQIAPDVDYVLVMSVNPGFSRQHFIEGSVSKVRQVRELLDDAGNDAAVEIDGGIGLENVGRVVAAGARMIVAGSAIFDGGDPERATRELKAAAMAALGPPVVSR